MFSHMNMSEMVNHVEGITNSWENKIKTKEIKQSIVNILYIL